MGKERLGNADGWLLASGIGAIGYAGHVLFDPDGCHKMHFTEKSGECHVPTSRWFGLMVAGIGSRDLALANVKCNKDGTRKGKRAVLAAAGAGWLASAVMNVTMAATNKQKQCLAYPQGAAQAAFGSLCIAKACEMGKDDNE